MCIDEGEDALNQKKERRRRKREAQLSCWFSARRTDLQVQCLYFVYWRRYGQHSIAEKYGEHITFDRTLHSLAEKKQEQPDEIHMHSSRPQTDRPINATGKQKRKTQNEVFQTFDCLLKEKENNTRRNEKENEEEKQNRGNFLLRILLFCST